jgi:hypothetical protein
MLGGFLTALPVVAVIAACDLALLYGALWLAIMSKPMSAMGQKQTYTCPKLGISCCSA